MKNRICVFFFFSMTLFSFSQKELKGMVMIKENQNKYTGVEGASVYWLGTTIGTVTNEKGWFQIPYKPSFDKLIISYVGYHTDTIAIKSNRELHHLLKESSSLEEVVLQHKKKNTTVSFYKPTNTIAINESELLKAACCNLSESFETNPSIDVHFSDALTGTKQIKMLGLNSPYLLVTQENIPSVRGASQVYGMTFIPGTWIQSIQVTKGAGTVINGFESIAGQINTELRKPRNDDALFFNAYASGIGRFELNTHVSKKLSEKWSTGLYVHGNSRNTKIDRNNDSFLDAPIGDQLNVMNRWQYANPKSGWVSFIDVKYVKDLKQAGDIRFNPKEDKLKTLLYGSEIDTERFETATKLGYVFQEKPYQSFGIQTAFSNHKQDSYFGLNTYFISHKSGYVNSIFQSILGSTQHKFKTGVSLTYDNYEEKVQSNEYIRTERSLGGFFEYTYDSLDKFIFVAGVRLDTHNLLGTFITPRLHARYELWEKGIFKASLGSGRRSANVFTENQRMFASSRSIEIENNGGNIYGLNPERAWNYGLSFLQGFSFLDKKGTIAFDFYRTDFEEQVIADYDTSPQKVVFYNLQGKSIANSFQIEINYELLPKLDIRMAYKYYDVKVKYKEGIRQMPFQPNYRFFMNLGYETRKNKKLAYWKFDTTYNVIGKQRIPDTNSNPIAFRLPEYSKVYGLLNAQITRVFHKKFEIYLGGENIGNYKQANPILSNENPFGTYFDTTLVYAPILGSMYYGGIRFKI